ncbi:unnamed protein product, partial [Staurois parvus]
PEDTAGTGSRCCALPGSAHKQGAGRPFIDGHPTLQCHPPQSGAHCVLRTPDTDWPISDHMQSSKQDVTCDIIAYYVSNL